MPALQSTAGPATRRPPPPPARPAGAGGRGPATTRPSLAAAADKMCRDVVSAPKDRPVVEGSATVRFLGADGAAIDVECAKSDYILDAGLAAGLELPYTCRSGICGACVGRVTAGAVDMSDIDDLEFTLNAAELEKGLALLCMARPAPDSDPAAPIAVETQSDYGYSLGSAEWNGATGRIEGGAPTKLM